MGYSMEIENKTKEQLINELRELRKQIAELKASEAERERAEEQYHALFKQAADSIVLIDGESGELVEFNQKAHEALGYTREEFAKLKISDFEVIETSDEVEKHIKKIIKKGTDLFETKHKTKGGEIRNIQVNSSAISIRGRNFVQSIWRDITERRQMEEALRNTYQELEKKVEERTAELKETNDFLESIFKTSADGLMVGDSEGYITMINEAMEKMIGYSKDELIGRHPIDLAKKDKAHKESGKKIVEEMLKKDVMTGLERTWEKKDGSLIDVEINLAFLKDVEGNITGSVAGIRDITERKKVEAELKKSEEKYQNLIENASDAIVSINQKGEVIEFNKKAEELFGYTHEEILGQPSYLLAAQRYRERQKKILKEYGKTGGILGLDKKILEGEGLKKDGQEFPVEFSYYFLELHGELIATAIVRDITESKEAEKKLVEYQNQLRSLASQLTLTEERERQRLATFVHDRIGQLLFISKLKLETLRESANPQDTPTAIQETLTLIEQMIKDSRSLTFELSPPILYQLGLEAALEWLTENTHKTYGIMVSFEYDKQDKSLDEETKILLFQAVRELLTNVAKHAQAKEAKVSIQSDSKYVRVCVEDDGIGFAPPCKHSSKDETKGFGLFSIKERLNNLGGRLEMTTQAGLGTRVSLMAPLMNKKEN